jgi:hypothetical protein
MKMKTLKQDTQTIVTEEYHALIEAGDYDDFLTAWRANVAKRFQEEIDLNDYAEDMATQACEQEAHRRTKDLPDFAQMLLPGFDWSELRETGFRYGKTGFVPYAKANYNQLTLRFMNQFDHANATMHTAAKTKEILDSEVGQLMRENPILALEDATLRFLDR